MREQPKHRIAPEVIPAWRIHASLYMGAYFILLIVLTVLAYVFEFSYIYSILFLVLGLICTYIFVYLLPLLRYRRWRYEIFDQEIYIQHGVLIMKRTIIPMLRVQHVDTEQGPILKRYNLATVSISTAATTHFIPALKEEDASALRDRISTLARVEEDDL
mgnify:CR=1 FL=1